MAFAVGDFFRRLAEKLLDLLRPFFGVAEAEAEGVLDGEAEAEAEAEALEGVVGAGESRRSIIEFGPSTMASG